MKMTEISMAPNPPGPGGRGARPRGGWRRGLLLAGLGWAASGWSQALALPPAELTDPAEKAKITQALPSTPAAQPARPRRLLIFDLNVEYGGHGSIPYANEALRQMGEKSGAYTTVVSRDPAVFDRESLETFDAVFFNNTVGNLFTDPGRRQNLIDFVMGGGGLMGVHGTSVAFTRWPGAHEDWPEFGLLLGARGASHRESDERVVLRLDDPIHPVVRTFGGQPFEYRDEFFRYGDPYSRQRVRVLLSIDTEKTDLNQGPARGTCLRDDNDYALAWVRNYGRGRVFYSSIAHHPRVFWDPRMLAFYRDAVQFVLGDLPAPTLPSGRLTPALRAQERLGWRLGIEAYTFHKFTLFETIDKTAALGLPFVGGLSFQKVSADIPKNLEPGLTEEELRQIRLKLEAAGLRMLTYYYQEIPGDEAGCRRLFEFARKLGIETFMSEPKLESLDTIERFADRYDIKVGLHNHDRKASPNFWHPDRILEVTKGRSPRLGACADVGYWMRDGIDPVEGLRKLGSRLITLQMHDLHAPGPEGHDVPWGTGVGQAARVFEELHRQGVRPVMFGLEFSYDWLDSIPEITQCIEFFNQTSLRLSPAP